jgi:integrase
VTERHLKPALGHMPLWKLTSRDCDQLYARMKAAGLGQSRVRCAHVVLYRAVAQAVRWGWLVRNPVSNATRPPVARVTITPPGIDDIRAALASSRKADVELWCWLQVAIASGARRGEVRPQMVRRRSRQALPAHRAVGLGNIERWRGHQIHQDRQAQGRIAHHAGD